MTMELEWLGEEPEFDLADRMRKALRHSGLAVQEMADYLGVSRNTVSTWINGRIEPGVQSVRLWALRTGVSHGWLVTGMRDIDRRVGVDTHGYFGWPSQSVSEAA